MLHMPGSGLDINKDKGEMKSMSTRIKTVDYLKTIAIVGIVFFHIGILGNGYLGVEVFFVISGYLFIKSTKSKIMDGTFNPVRFILKKLSDFYPLIVVAGGISLIIGYLGMLPDDYENLAESIVASNVFANNILQAITTKNYWDVVNTYKPLMHTWYIGVLMQTFVFLACLLWMARKVLKKDYTCNILIGLSVVSITLCFLPIFTASDKFYFFPFRMFEITMGGLLAYFPGSQMKEKTLQLLGNLGIVVLLFLLFGNISGSNTVLVILTVAATCIVCWAHSSINEDYGVNDKLYSIITLPGKYSYDIYIWHQLVIAFLLYFKFPKVNIQFILLTLCITVAMSVISVLVRTKCVVLRTTKSRIIICAFLAVVTGAASMYIYMQAGVVRSIPELGIDIDNVHRNMHAEYVDVPYSWDKDFEEDSKIHALVIGNSFGRDFANILNESAISDQLEISYIYEDSASEKMDRIEAADIVFYGTNGWTIPNWIIDNVDSDKLYIVGNKEFGSSNGIIYANRKKEWYFDQKVALADDFILNNGCLITNF